MDKENPKKFKSEHKRLKSRLEELERQLSFARYKQGDMFPHPHWREDELRLEKEIKTLKSKIRKLND